MRHKWGFMDYFAECQDCEWKLFGKNALGVAAKHCDKTGHTVTVQKTGCTTFCGDEEHNRRVADRAVQKV